jgi:Co/Zn/Cd efflux system component
LAAVATAAAAVLVAGAWWADPTGAIVISLYIVWRWIEIARAQVRQRQAVHTIGLPLRRRLRRAAAW